MIISTHSVTFSAKLLSPSLVRPQFEGLVLVEPLIVPLADELERTRMVFAKTALARRSSWLNREEALAAMKQSRTSCSWHPDVLKIFAVSLTQFQLNLDLGN